MKRRFLCFLLIALLTVGLCSCTVNPPSGPSDTKYDPAAYVYFFNDETRPSFPADTESVTATLHNDSTVSVRTAAAFTVKTQGTPAQTAGNGVTESTVIESGTTEELRFDLSKMNLQEETSYELTLSCNWTDADGTTKSFDISYFFFCSAPGDVDPVVPPHDLMKTPISDLTQEEQKELAEYLFENYIPCSFGIFDDVKDLSSPSIWSSVEALNRRIDQDESDQSRTLAEVLKKVAVYFPDATFHPEKVRVYDKATQTFYASPASTEKYVFLSYEVKDGQITIHYEDQPDENDPEADPMQYATTLKNSSAEGYFAFVSSVRTGAVG